MQAIFSILNLFDCFYVKLKTTETLLKVKSVTAQRLSIA